MVLIFAPPQNCNSNTVIARGPSPLAHCHRPGRRKATAAGTGRMLFCQGTARRTFARGPDGRKGAATLLNPCKAKGLCDEISLMTYAAAAG